MKKAASSRKKAKATPQTPAKPAIIYVEKEERGIDLALRKRAEKKLASSPKRDVLSGIDALKLVHELQVHQIELEMQNEELQRAAAAVDESRERYSYLYDFAPIGYITLDDTGIVREANLAIARMLGYERGFLLQKPFQSFVFPEDKNAFLMYSQRLVSSDSTTTFDIRLARKDKSVFYAQIASTVFRNTINSGRQFFLSIQDFTGRKHVEERLALSEKRFRNLFESMDEGFALCEMLYDDAGKPLDFRYIEVNPAFARQTGLSVERVVGRRVKEVIPGIEQSWIETYGRIVETGRAERIDNPVAELGKHFELFSWRSGPGQFAVVFNDITDRVHAEMLLRVQAEELAFANKELEAFGFSVSHDLRSPLHSIGACCAVISKDPETFMGKNSKVAFGYILQTTQRMSEIITDLLALSRIARQEILREPTDLSDMVRVVHTELKSFTPDRSIEFTIEPDCIANADAGLSRILIENLVRNAWKYSSKTANARIEFGARRDSAATDYFVKDNGVGFDMGNVDTLFKPFHRLHSDKEFKGTGIGLAIAKRIVDKHHGKIWAEAEKDRGATFYFRLE